MITLSERQTKTRDNAEQKITEVYAELEFTIMAANALDIKPEIPAKFLAKATELANGFKQVIQDVGEFVGPEACLQASSHLVSNLLLY